jgi:hypothetical protein
VTYRGGVRRYPPSSVALEVKCKRGKRQVRSFVVKDLLISCPTTDARLSSAKITGAVKVNDKGKFRIKGRSGGQELKLTGKLYGKRNANGTVRYSGPTAVDGQTMECTSGKVRWRASR